MKMSRKTKRDLNLHLYLSLYGCAVMEIHLAHITCKCTVCNSFCLCFLIDDSEAADLWLLNSCTVKNPSEDNFRNAIKRAQELDKHLVVAGCVPQGQPRHQTIKGISVIGVYTFYVC